jgi:peptidase MA superfamily protein
MRRPLLYLLCSAVLVLCWPVALAAEQAAIAITDQRVELAFPDRLTFSAHIESDAEIDRVILEYGVDQLTCGTVTGKAFPDLAPGKAADVSWTWEMRQSGSEPPGATIWYRWRATDKAGNQHVTDDQRVTWLDDSHPWRSVSRGKLTLHWYDGSTTFANTLLNSAVDSLDQLARTTGVAPESPINLYIYATTADMRDAVLYQPGWTGGLAFSGHDIVTIGISPDQIAWGKRTAAHELTHVLVGHLAFSCLGSVPTWLNEGIAVYGEGGPDPESAQALVNAIAADRLLTVRALSGGFSEDPGRANLSYTQSYSLVAYLVNHFGQAKLNQVFVDLRQGTTIDDALQSVYGFGLDGLEDRWRAAVGAPARRAAGTAPTTTPLPSPVPTYQPIDAAPHSAAPVAGPTAAIAAAPTALPAEPTAAAAPAPQPAPAAAPVARNVSLLVVGIVVLLLVAVGLAVFFLGMPRKPST